ncbi:NUDIX domain-containing protein [Arcanobacterium buesumense]|uniref:NUDIX hydrolase n=1 Tax=Arcanobacterium buesumense TaxID=2722751 RepID=A0A6H2EL34_9ACTO|nr:NUDIX hydrolase [Arcanobacterium buesumense]QJC21843.1 NUDIX hydrolase [Arcanobacterium buesumense]
MKKYLTVAGEIPLKDMTVADHVDLLSRKKEFSGPIFDIYNDCIRFQSGDVAKRQYMIHDDAVGIIALRPSEDSWQVLLIHQYRHAPRQLMWEIPAGLCDVPGEALVNTAARELAEEAGYGARQWEQLARFHASAGVSDEMVTIFLARDVFQLEKIDFEREDEEREISVHWIDITEIRDAIFRGDLTSPALVVGILAACEKLVFRA